MPPGLGPTAFASFALNHHMASGWFLHSLRGTWRSSTGATVALAGHLRRRHASTFRHPGRGIRAGCRSLTVMGQHPRPWRVVHPSVNNERRNDMDLEGRDRLGTFCLVSPTLGPLRCCWLLRGSMFRGDSHPAAGSSLPGESDACGTARAITQRSHILPERVPSGTRAGNVWCGHAYAG
jgi:hypothetical protein